MGRNPEDFIKFDDFLVNVHFCKKRTQNSIEIIDIILFRKKRVVDDVVFIKGNARIGRDGIIKQSGVF
jgi:hypothetical protein